MWDLSVSVPDHCLSFYFDPDRPVFRQAHKTANIDSRNVCNSISVCSKDPFSFGTYGVHGPALAGRQSQQATPKVVNQGP